MIAETRLALKPGVLELLDTLTQMRLPCAIATSSSHRTIERHLTSHNLVGRFDAIIGHGDYENGKPAPDPFLKPPNGSALIRTYVWRWRPRITVFGRHHRPE